MAGLIFESAHLDEHWARLDEFEGIGYERVSVVAQGVDGPVEALIYVTAPATGSDWTIHSE